MKLTLTLHSTKASYTRQVAVRHIVSGIVLASLMFLVSSRSTESIMEDYARVQVAQAQLHAKEGQLSELSDDVAIQLQAYAAQIAQLRQALAEVHQTQSSIASKLNVEELIDDEQGTETSSIALANEPLMNQLTSVKAELENKQNQLHLLEKLVSGRHIQEQVSVSGRPIGKGWLSSYYGLRDDPFTGKPAMHKGLDFAGKEGAPILATGAGLVTWSGDRYGYGLLVEINHGNGLVTRYGHTKALAVKVGDVVTKGQTIATMGSTGRSTGTHVHYEVLKNGQQVDPLAYLR